jgi:magnesium chelatase family protein
LRGADRNRVQSFQQIVVVRSPVRPWTKPKNASVAQQQFRSQRHSASLVTIMGIGNNPRPDEISLAHQAVLFLDGMLEFNRAILEALRQPLEDRSMTTAYAKDNVEYAANFLLVTTANPCRSAFFGSSKTFNA